MFPQQTRTEDCEYLSLSTAAFVSHFLFVVDLPDYLLVRYNSLSANTTFLQDILEQESMFIKQKCWKSKFQNPGGRERLYFAANS